MGNAIVPATGQARFTEVDYADGGPHPLDIVRVYLSQLFTDGSNAPGLHAFWDFGLGATIANDALGTTRLSIGAGQTALLFTAAQTADAQGGYSFAASWTPVHTADSLTAMPVSGDPYAAASQWTYRRALDDSTWVFDGQGRLLTQTQRNGWVMHYSYNTAGQLSQVTNHFGRSLVLAYNASNAVSSITTPDGQVTGYDYDTTASVPRLTAVHYPDGTSKGYAYANSSFPLALTGVTDPAQTLLTAIAYDAQGRATSAGTGVGLYTVAYGASTGTSTGASTASVTSPLGAQRSYGYSINQRRLVVTSASAPPAEGAGAAASCSQDTAGLPQSRSDFLGTPTQFSWNSARRLLLAATTAAGTAVAQTASTQWHPTLALPVKVATPGVLTTYVYNGQPDPFNANASASCAPAGALGADGNPIPVLCKKVQQATADADGSAGLSPTLQASVLNRVWTWAHDADGRVLIASDPLGHSTSTSYYSDTGAGHNRGDLQSSTNALGQVRQYNAYNGAGQLLQSTDPNGVVTTYTYDARQRLASSSVDGQATGYTYTAAGQISQVTLPGGSSVAYSYDAAQRLVAVVDAQGNSINYTLDNAGNRIAEQVKDPAGSLRRQVSRVFDTLGRPQKITGQE